MVTTTEFGKLEISDDVIARIAGISANQCDGIVGMASQKVTDGIVELLGLDNITKGVRVTGKADKLIIDLYIMVKFGVPIIDTAETVMKKVQNDIRDLTGLEVDQVNVIVEGIQF